MDNRVIQAEEELLLQDNREFILRTASRVLGRRITLSDDEYSVALMAFWEASSTHDPGKGSLHSYAAVVIRHRLIDSLRRQQIRSWELPVSPEAFSGEAPEEEIALQRVMERAAVQRMSRTELAEEIADLAETLRRYRIDFFDLPDCCPKACKTRGICLRAARFVCRAAELLARLRRTLRLPQAEMETGVPIARRLLEKFRKYIIASVEIEAGDYPGLQEYFAGKEG